MQIPFSATTPARAATLNAFAMVGFFALVALGMALAVYSSRFVPGTIGRLGTAAVFLSEVFTPASPTLTVIPSDSIVIPFGPSSTSSVAAPVTPAAPTTPKPVLPVAGTPTNESIQISGGSPTLSGLANLAVTIDAIGYLETTSAESFVASTTVPARGRPAVSFTIKNIGTNKADAWRFSASIPTSSSYLYQSPIQQALNPGDSIRYTLGFDQAIPGVDKTISISVNFDRILPESSFEDNGASAKITISGGS